MAIKLIAPPLIDKEPHTNALTRWLEANIRHFPRILQLPIAAVLRPRPAVGGGGIFYRQGPKANSLWVGCAARSARVGKGYGISFGGFANTRKLLQSSVGTIMPLMAEINREKREEIPGAEGTLTAEAIDERKVFLTSFTVRTPDINLMHQTIYFGIPVNLAEQTALSALPVGHETTTPLEFFLLEWNPDDPSDATLHVPAPLFHKHEAVPFLALAKLAAAGRLPFQQ